MREILPLSPEIHCIRPTSAVASGLTKRGGGNDGGSAEAHSGDVLAVVALVGPEAPPTPFRTAAVLAAMALALVGVISSAQADANSDSATGVADGLRSFAARLDDSADALGDYQALAQSLPLVDLAPGSDQALRLSTLLQEQLTAGSKTLDATYNTLGELESDLEALDELQDGVQFTVGDVSISGSPGGAIDVVVPINATRHVDQPLDFQAGIASIDGGSIGIDFSLSSTLTFRLDTSGGAPFPATAFSLVVPSGTAPAIDLCASVDAAIASFTARLGFTDVTLSTDDPATSPAVEKAKLKSCAKVSFSDPDSNGVLTKDEFSSHALTEFATAALVDGDPAGNDLDAKFFLDASLVPGNADGTITFTDLNLPPHRRRRSLLHSGTYRLHERHAAATSSTG